MKPVSRPRIIANLAMTADGKIDSARREGPKFSSRIDRDRMDALRAEADVLIVGAATIRAEDPPLRVKDPSRRAARLAAGRHEELIVVVLSHEGRIPAAARFLREPAASRWLVVPGDLPEAALTALTEALDAGTLTLFRAGSGAVDLAALVAHLSGLGARTLLVEGGGETVARFLADGLLDELNLTICPTILGGRGAPTPVEGPGFSMVERRMLTLAAIDRVGDELFLKYIVAH
ncbi:MAG: dihydrofolate reductase family protein [Acidobacteriota bacterium]